MIKKSNNKSAKEENGEVKPQKSFTYPQHKITIQATSREEANKKLAKLLDEKSEE